MQKKNPYIFYFIDKYNIDELTKLEKNIDLIFRNYSKRLKIDEIKSIQRFCKINKRNLYLSNNIKLALRLGLSGVYIPSFNNSLNFASKHSLPNKFEIIGDLEGQVTWFPWVGTRTINAASLLIEIASGEHPQRTELTIKSNYSSLLQTAEFANKLGMEIFTGRVEIFGFITMKKMNGFGLKFPNSQVFTDPRMKIGTI